MSLLAPGSVQVFNRTYVLTFSPVAFFSSMCCAVRVTLSPHMSYKIYDMSLYNNSFVIMMMMIDDETVIFAVVFFHVVYFT